MAYNDPMAMPGPSKMQRLIQSDLQDLRQEIATSEQRGQAWVDREEKRTHKLEQQKADEEELDKRLDKQKQLQRTRTELEELVLALTEQVRQLVHQSAGIAERARAEAWAEARQQLAAAEAKGTRKRKAQKAELEAALEAKRVAESATQQAKERQEAMADLAETAEGKRAADKMRVVGLYLSRNTVVQIWGRWRADWEAEVQAAKARKHEQAIAAATAARLELEAQLKASGADLERVNGELHGARNEVTMLTKWGAGLEATSEAEAQRRLKPRP